MLIVVHGQTESKIIIIFVFTVLLVGFDYISVRVELGSAPVNTRGRGLGGPLANQGPQNDNSVKTERLQINLGQ